MCALVTGVQTCALPIYEYIIGQELNVWPFNGSELDWWQESGWVAKVKDADTILEARKKELAELKETPQKERAEDHIKKVTALEEGIKTLEEIEEAWCRERVCQSV